MSLGRFVGASNTFASSSGTVTCITNSDVAEANSHEAGTQSWTLSEIMADCRSAGTGMGVINPAATRPVLPDG
jgi:hypothetical protein